jgi:hypothetical protein
LLICAVCKILELCAGREPKFAAASFLLGAPLQYSYSHWRPIAPAHRRSISRSPFAARCNHLADDTRLSAIMEVGDGFVVSRAKDGQRGSIENVEQAEIL